MDIYGSQHPMIKSEPTGYLVYADKELMTPLVVDFEGAHQLYELITDLSPTTNVEILGVHELDPRPNDSGEGRVPSLPSLAGKCPTNHRKNLDQSWIEWFAGSIHLAFLHCPDCGISLTTQEGEACSH